MNSIPRPFSWNHQRETAALLVAEDRLSDLQISRQLGIGRQTLVRWKALPEFHARVNEHVASLQSALNDPIAASDLLASFDSRQQRKRKRRGQAVVYFLRADNGLVKIGQTLDFARRLRTLNTYSPYDLEILRLIPTLDPYGVESFYHRRFADKRVRGEWFKVSVDEVMNDEI